MHPEAAHLSFSMIKPLFTGKICIYMDLFFKLNGFLQKKFWIYGPFLKRIRFDQNVSGRRGGRMGPIANSNESQWRPASHKLG
jgi:hypothetical protein